MDYSCHKDSHYFNIKAYSTCFSTENITFYITVFLVMQVDKQRGLYSPPNLFRHFVNIHPIFSNPTCSKSHLYFIPVLTYTPNKVKSEQRGEKKWLRQADQPIYQNPQMPQPIFSFGCKNIRASILFLVDFSWWNYHLFRTFATDRKQVDFGRETAVFPLVPIQEKRTAKWAVLSLKNKWKMAFLPFKRQFFRFQAVRYAASENNRENTH